MNFLALSVLFTALTAAKVYATALEIAEAFGLPVTSWRDGDPTKTLLEFCARILTEREGWTIELAKSAFLSTASGAWLTILALEVYGVNRALATYATPTVTITNAGGGRYVISNGSHTFKCSATGITYHSANETPIEVVPGGTYTIELVADVAGSDGTVGVNDVDSIVTTMLQVSIVSSTASSARDEESDDALKSRCRASTGALSPDGPRDAYEFVVLNSELTGVTDITRALTIDDSDTGHVRVLLAGPSGPVLGSSVTAAQLAVDKWAAPWTVTATVENTSVMTQDIAVSINQELPPDAEGTVSDAIAGLFANADIGAPIAHDAIRSAIRVALALSPSATVTLTTPAGDVDPGETATVRVGTVNLTEV